MKNCNHILLYFIKYGFSFHGGMEDEDFVLRITLFLSMPAKFKTHKFCNENGEHISP